MSNAPNAAPDPSFLPEGWSRPSAHGWAWIRDGFELFRRQPGTWIGLILVWLVLSVALGFVPVLGSVANQLLSPVFVAGMMLGCRALDGGHSISVASLFAAFSVKPGALIAVGALSLVAIVAIIVAAVVALGLDLSLFVGDPTPGDMLSLLTAVTLALVLLVPVYMAIWFAPALIVFHQVPVFDALRGSFLGCLANPGALAVYGLALVGLSILAAVPFGLGFLVLIPVVVTSTYVAYRDIFYAP